MLSGDIMYQCRHSKFGQFGAGLSGGARGGLRDQEARSLRRRSLIVSPDDRRHVLVVHDLEARSALRCWAASAALTSETPARFIT